MKNLLFILVFFSFATTAFGQNIVQSSCTAPDSVRAKYLKSAYKLAVKEILQRNDPYADSMVIPHHWRDTILNAMLAVHNATTLPARDTVVDSFKIDHVQYVAMDRMYFRADTSWTWMQNFQSYVFPSGLEVLDEHIDDYNLIQSVGSLNGTKRHAGVKSPDTFFNFRAMSDALEALPQVDTAYPYIDPSDYDRIRVITDSLFPTHVQLTYTYGWGDCPSGCIYERSWVFNVYPGCMVEFAGSYGDLLYPAASIVGAPRMSGFSVSPNPVTDFVQVRLPVAATISIRNALGQTVAHRALPAGTHTIPATDWPAGVYFYAADFGGGQARQTGTFIRQ